MNLNINSPACYKEVHGIDNEIYRFCQSLYIYFKGKHYSDQIDIIGIVPVIAPKEKFDQGLWKERKECNLKAGFAFVSLHIDYEAYINKNVDGKKRLMVDNVLRSVKAFARRGKIDYDLFRKDMETFCKDYGIK